MKKIFYLLLFPAMLSAQSNDGRQLVALSISYDPDQMDIPGKYYLILEKPTIVHLKLNQTFLLQSAWHKEGDSIVTIGAGTVRSMSDTSAEVVGTLLPGKTIQKGDMALFLVPLAAPGKDSLFFKMARVGILFTTLGDSIFYERNSMLKAPETYPTQKLLDEMAKDIRFTGNQMSTNYSSQDRDITYGAYKDQKLFAMMQKTSSADVLEFLRYVYAKPDKYKAHTWKISETFATWVINGAPKVIK
jgi:hypothetical protein